MAQSRRLGIELCFRTSPSAELWTSVLRTVVTWDARLVPRRLDRLSDADRPGEEAWSDARWDELARLCAADAPRSWQLIGNDATLDVSRKTDEVRLSIALARPVDELESLVRLLEALRVVPALAMLIDVESQDDGRFLFQGLTHLDDVPPVFFLDALACDQLGGAARLRQAPVDVRDVAGGLLFLAKPLFRKRGRADTERIAATRQVLGMDVRTSLSLVGAPHTPVAVQWKVEQEPIGHAQILGVPVAPVIDGPALRGGCAGAGGDAWVVGDRGTIAFCDADDGEWGQVESGDLAPRDYAAVCDVPGGDVWVVGAAASIVRFDGEVWRDVDVPSASAGRALHGVWGVTAGVVLAVGERGVVLQWNGREWYEDASGVDRTLFAIAGVAGAAWAVGEGGVISGWNGDEWASVRSPTTTTLRGVSVASRDIAWAVGDGGTVLRRHEGAWQAVDAGTRTDLHGVYAAADDDVWAVGDGGTIRHFDGLAWAEVASDSRETLRAVWSDGEGGVRVCGSNHVLLRIRPMRAG